MSGMETHLRVRRIQRCKKWQALDMVPMKVGQQQVHTELFPGQLALQFQAQLAYAGAGINDQHGLVNPQFDACCIAATTQKIIGSNRNGAPNTPEFQPNLRLCAHDESITRRNPPQPGPAYRSVLPSPLVDQISDQSSPACLMACTQSLPRFAVVVLIEKQVVPPVGISLKLIIHAETGTVATLIRLEDRDHAVRYIAGQVVRNDIVTIVGRGAGQAHA